MAEQKQSFWGWLSDNPVTALFMLMLIAAGIGIIYGYREYISSVITGIFGFLTGDDSTNKIKRLEASKRSTDEQFAGVNRLIEGMKSQQIIHDEEVESSGLYAHSEVDEMDDGELVDLGNTMLRDAGVLRSES